MGFGTDDNSGISDYEKVKEKILEESKRVFKPEFLNRINDMVIFHSLNREHLIKIVELELTKVTKRLIEHNIKLTVYESN